MDSSDIVNSTERSIVPGSQEDKDQERVLITRDDILIEYVDRLMREIQNINDADLKQTWKI